jgi:uncharacterized protein YebE (UPF0316 family)
VFLIGNFLFIFIARMADVALMTIRMLMIVRGRRVQAALIGFFEVTIYILALGQVMQNIDNTYSILAYALGFSSGNFLGSYLEEKMAMGFMTVHVISKDYADELVEALRDLGYGVTVVNGMGRYRLRKLLYITLRRKDLSSLLAQIEKEDKEAFVTVMDTRAIRGGFLFNRREK